MIDINPDSASFYIESAKDAVYILENSDYKEDRIEGCLGHASILIIEGQDGLAKEFLEKYIKIESDVENVETTKNILNNFEDFKSTIMDMSHH